MQLYKIQEFEVRSRTSSMQFKDSPKGSPAIGQELNVNFLLEGSTQRYGDMVRIRVQLIQASTDDHIWGEVYEGAWKNIYNIQINVAKQVAHELKTALSNEEIERIEKEPTGNIEAYNLYLLGRHFSNQGGRQFLDRSFQCYSQALDMDPEFALAHFGMANSYIKYATAGYVSRKEVMFKAKEAAIRALQIDNELAEAHAELAYAKLIHDYDWAGAKNGFIRALELNPDYAGTHFRYARLLTWLLRFDEAQGEYKRAYELDPLSIQHWQNIGRCYYWMRDYDRAIEEYQKVLEVFPDSESTIALLALAYSHKGMHKRAIEEIMKIKDKSAWYWFIPGHIYGNAGRIQEAQEILNYYLELSRNEFVWPSNFVFIYAGMGEKEKAMEWLEKTYVQREAWLETTRVESMFDNLRSDPRFQEIVDRMDFPDN
jgi:tetratricopeptide (TPR) repeat protein